MRTAWPAWSHCPQPFLLLFTAVTVAFAPAKQQFAERKATVYTIPLAIGNPSVCNASHPFFSIFAHVSTSDTVRLNTGFSGVESGSTQK